MQKTKDNSMKTDALTSDWHDGWFVWDEFYSKLDEMAENYIQDLDDDMSFDNFLDIAPNKAYAASREYIKVLSVNKLIAKIARCSNEYETDHYAQEIWETSVNDIWLGCDDEFTEEPNGIDELQNAIDRFATKNRLIYRLFRKFKWGTPILFLCGKKALKKALEDFKNENRHFWVYTQSGEFIDLNAKFWKFWINAR
jgi:hypothetical protein